MIVLWSRAHQRAFVVVVVLISDIPVEPVVKLDSQARFGRLKTHRIRGDQRAWCASWIGESASLAVIFVYSICGKQRGAGSDPGHRFDKEKIVPYVVQAVAKRMLNTVEEIIDYRLAVYPMVVVASANRQS